MFCCSCTEPCGKGISRHEADMQQVQQMTKSPDPDTSKPAVVPDCFSGEADGIQHESSEEEEENQSEGKDDFWNEADDPVKDSEIEARLSKASSADEAAEDEEPGLYELINAVLVRREVDTASPQVDDGQLHRGSFVNVLEVIRVDDRIRARIEEPSGWISLRRPTTGDRWAVKAVQAPGLYEIVRESVVREDVDLDSAEVEGSPLSIGNYVNVVHVIHVDDRVRAKIDEPAGWISLLATAPPARFAEEARYRPGCYRLLDSAIVRATDDLNSDRVNNGEQLPAGLDVDVVEVKYRGGRVRGRLEMPCHGWISLLKIDPYLRLAEEVGGMLANGTEVSKVETKEAAAEHLALNVPHHDEKTRLTEASSKTEDERIKRSNVSKQWTICLLFLCLPILPGAVFSHIAFGQLLPPLEKLPTNVATGFDEVFKFDYLEQDAKAVQNSASTAFTKCLSAGESCSSSSYAQASTQVDTSAEKADIVAAFDRSLSIVKKVSGDKYFGTPELQDTFKELTKITAELDKVTGTMPCSGTVPIYCTIHISAGNIVAGMSTVTDAINEFKESDAVDVYEENAAKLNFLHALPYIIVVGLFFLVCFLKMGGVCCCCSCCCGERCSAIGNCAVIIYILFWFISLVVYGSIVGAKILLGHEEAKLTVFNGEPSVGDLAEHIESTFPGFWNVVFKDLVEGLEKLWLASTLLVSSVLSIGLFSICVCCCRPYGRPKLRRGDSWKVTQGKVTPGEMDRYHV